MDIGEIIRVIEIRPAFPIPEETPKHPAPKEPSPKKEPVPV